MLKQPLWRRDQRAHTLTTRLAPTFKIYKLYLIYSTNYFLLFFAYLEIFTEVSIVDYKLSVIQANYNKFVI